MNEHTDITPGRGPKLPMIAGVEITTDAHGRFNLNALHRASGGEKSKQPSNWLRLDSTNALILEMEARCSDLSNAGSHSSDLRSGPVATVNGGSAPGTFAHELLAIDYAGWISPAFRLQVHQVFIDYRTGKLAPMMPTFDPNDPAQLLPLLTAYAHRTQIAEAKVVEWQPKAEAFDRLDTAEGNLTLRPASKVLGYPEQKLGKWMEVNRWAFRQNGKGPLQAYVDKRNAGYLDHKLGRYIDQHTGEEKTSITLVITPKGMAKLAQILPRLQ